MRSYIPLHIHSGYSFLDGAIKFESYGKELLKDKIPAGAITDHGNLSGTFKFFNVFKKLGIKPILGIEAYFTKQVGARDNEEKFSHTILLAKSLHGFKNLMKLSSFAYLKNKYKKPLLSLEYLKSLPKEEYNDIIVTSACISNTIAQCLVNDDYPGACEQVRRHQEVFGDDFYLEVHPNTIDVQPKINRGIIKLAKELGAKPIVVTDSHYLCHKDWEAHDVLLAIQTKADLQDENRFRFNGQDFFLQDDEYMEKILLSHGLSKEEIDWCKKNTFEIAEKIQEIKSLSTKEHFVPKFPIPADEEFIKFQAMYRKYDDSEAQRDYIRFKISQGIKKKFGDIDKAPKVYMDRLRYELDVLNKFNLIDYFLIVSDYVEWAKKQGILTGYGRGSSAGSLVNYFLGTTCIDPIEHKLVFERFLNPGRLETGEYPDIDTDFQNDRREEVINYLRNKYGENNVSFIGTQTDITNKLAFKDACRVLGVEFSTSNELSKHLPDESLEFDIEKTPKIKELLPYSEKLRKVVEYVPFLTGLPKNSGVHASGVIIAPKEVWSYVPVKDSENGMVTQWDMKDCEKTGLVKFDVLGIKNLTVIKNLLNALEKKGIKEDFYNVDFTIPNVYEMIGKGLTQGVFQLETGLNTSITVRFRPKSLDDISVIVSICRPGSLDIVQNYIDIRNGILEPTYIDERLKPILGETLGFCIYQEQALEIVKQLAGFSYTEADRMRRAIGKKEHEVMAECKKLFMEKFDGDKIVAEQIFAFLEKAQDYSFNKAHAMSYAVLTYLTAYFKYKYPTQFYTELIEQFVDNTDKLEEILSECVDRGITIVKPSVERHNSRTECDDTNIYLGFGMMKGFGVSVIRKLGELKFDAGDFISLAKDAFRVGLSRPTFESLIKCGSLDSYGFNRPQMLAIYDIMCTAFQGMKTKKETLKKSGLPNPKWLEEKNRFEKPQIVETPDWSEKTKEANEVEVLGLRVRRIMLESKKEQILASTDEARIGTFYDGEEVKLVGEITSVRDHTDKKGRKMAFLDFQTLGHKLKVTVFSKELASHEPLLRKGLALIARLKFQAKTEKFGENYIFNAGREYLVKD